MGIWGTGLHGGGAGDVGGCAMEKGWVPHAPIFWKPPRLPSLKAVGLGEKGGGWASPQHFATLRETLVHG